MIRGRLTVASAKRKFLAEIDRVREQFRAVARGTCLTSELVAHCCGWLIMMGNGAGPSSTDSSGGTDGCTLPLISAGPRTLCGVGGAIVQA